MTVTIAHAVTAKAGLVAGSAGAQAGIRADLASDDRTAANGVGTTRIGDHPAGDHPAGDRRKAGEPARHAVSVTVSPMSSGPAPAGRVPAGRRPAGTAMSEGTGLRVRGETDVRHVMADLRGENRARTVAGDPTSASPEGMNEALAHRSARVEVRRVETRVVHGETATTTADTGGRLPGGRAAGTPTGTGPAGVIAGASTDARAPRAANVPPARAPAATEGATARPPAVIPTAADRIGSDRAEGEPNATERVATGRAEAGRVEIVRITGARNVGILIAGGQTGLRPVRSGAQRGPIVTLIVTSGGRRHRRACVRGTTIRRSRSRCCRAISIGPPATS